MLTEMLITRAYNSAKSTATELESIASDLLKLANMEYENILVSLSNVWQGENSERFVWKGRTVKEQLLDTAQEIRSAATELRKNAKATYDTEMKELEIAREKERRLQREKEMEEERNKEIARGLAEKLMNEITGGNTGGGGSR